MFDSGVSSSGSVSTTDADTGAVVTRFADVVRSWWISTRQPWVDPGWYDAPIRPQVRALLDLPLGPELITALNGLPSGPCPADHTGEGSPDQPTPGSAPGFVCACQVVTTTAWDAITSWAAARAAAQLVEVTGARPVTVPGGAGTTISDPAGEELAAGLRVSPNSMRNRINTARDHAAHPQLLAWVSRGGCSMWTAKLIIGETVNLDDETAATVVDRTLAKITQRHQRGARPWTAGQTRQAAKRARLSLGKEADDRAREQARRQRRVSYRPDPDGMAALTAILPETDAHRIWCRLTSISQAIRQDPGETRTLDQIRADLLTDLLLGYADVPQPTEPERPTGTDIGVDVVIRLETLLGLNDDPAHLPGIGPVPAQTARELAADGKWRAWTTDATGTITTTGSRAYTPTAALARLIRARHPHCRMPGCRHPARACDLDHAIPWPNGPTTINNLGPLCRRHHNLKTHHRWQLQPHPDQDTTDQDTTGWTWTTPAGITIHDQPEPALE